MKKSGLQLNQMLERSTNLVWKCIANYYIKNAKKKKNQSEEVMNAYQLILRCIDLLSGRTSLSCLTNVGAKHFKSFLL